MNVRLLCAAAGAATIVACAMGGAQRSTAMPQTAGAPAPQELPQPSSPKDDEIAALARQIDDERSTLDLPRPTPDHTSAVPMSQDAHAQVAPVAPTQATCHPASDACSQACTLSGSICTNAKKICDIASELPGDAWASNKCAEGNQTCADAKKHCCDCAP
ncbi:MAG TPA: hypothetical protein VFQ65_28455 [Kofleriaceae bacterium]|nr:hypothetical protein [Kofleriaceae bacterium]